MRIGTSAESLRLDQEHWRQSQDLLTEEQQHLFSLQPEDIEDLSTDDGNGNNVSVFVLGLNSPFDGVPRLFPGTRSS